MNDNNTIKECNIEAPRGFGDQAKVNVVYEDGTTETVVKYYTDELAFSENEFIGLTREQAKDLFHKKDVAYLQS